MSLLTAGTDNLPAVLVGVVVAFLLLTLLIAGSIAGVVMLGRRAHKKGIRPLKNEKYQQKSDNTKCGGATEGEKRAEVHIYDDDYDDTCIDGRAVLYQGLDVGTQDYASVYTQLRREIYQELDPRGREEEHHYQRVSKREGLGRSDLL